MQNVQNNQTSRKTTVTITLAAIFSALAFLSSIIFHLPLIPSVSFLKYDPMDAILTIEALVLGPIPAILSTLVVTVIRIPFGSSGLIGALMNFLSSISFVLPSGIIYKYRRNLSGALIGLGCSIISETVIMLLWNYLISPLYMGVSREDIVKLMLPGFLPFNLIKATVNAALTFLLYKPMMTGLRMAGVIPKFESKSDGKILPIIINIACILFLAVGIICLFVFNVI